VQNLHLGEGKEIKPTINLINSHNRSRRFSLIAGLHRLVCSNGLYVAVAGANTTTTRIHLGGVNIDRAINKALSSFVDINDKYNRMNERTLTRSETQAFASRAVVIKHNCHPIQVSDRDIDTALQSRRSVDSTDTVWHVFNRCQENLIEKSSSRGIKEVRRVANTNLKMWELAESFLN
jgi:hypothetical protein